MRTVSSRESQCVIINPNDVPTMPYGVGTDKVGFIDIIAFGTDKQACLYDMNRDNTKFKKINSNRTKNCCPLSNTLVMRIR